MSDEKVTICYQETYVAAGGLQEDSGRILLPHEINDADLIKTLNFDCELRPSREFLGRRPAEIRIRGEY